MADEGNVISNLDLDGDPNGEDTGPPPGIISQYVKDLSVENPNAPESFQWQDAPQIDVQFNIGARPIDDEVHEVELKIALTAKCRGGHRLHRRAGLLRADRHAQPRRRRRPTPSLYAEAPRILFPFARRVIADAVRDAGFPPLMLEPIDFNGLYVQQLMRSSSEAADRRRRPATPEPAPGGARPMSLLKNVGTIGGLTAISRVFGFARDMLLARVLGAGLAADAFQLAFTLPNTFRRLFAEGAFSVAFVPMYSPRAAWRRGKGRRGSGRELRRRRALGVRLGAAGLQRAVR